MLGSLFYRFISENFIAYFDDDETNYAAMSDDEVPSEGRVEAIKTKGYFIYPSQLFSNIVKDAHQNDNLNIDLAQIFSDIEASAIGYSSEGDIKGLFADFDTTSTRLGNNVKAKNARLSAVLKGVAGLDFGNAEIAA